MTAATVAQSINFTRDDLNAAANVALSKVGSDKAWAGAINRALTNLASGRFSFDGHQVILHSASTDAVYHIDIHEPMQCTCRGHARGFRCWHIVAARLIVRAAERHASQGVMYKGQYYTADQLDTARWQRLINAQAAADALYS